MITGIKRLTESEFKNFTKLIHDESGIYMKDSKLTLLSNRLRKRLKDLDFGEFKEYYSFLINLKGNEKKAEYEKLLDVVSTNETYFFRNERHFDSLSNHCLPELAKRIKNRRLTIWSAACSTGEEPYTIAICLMEKIGLFQGWDVKIIATDIAPTVLDFARVGEYSGRRIEKVPRALLNKYFTPKKNDPGTFIINDEIKKIVHFNYLNFFKGKFPENIDIIFCRNVMIYFDKDYQKNLISRFYKIINKEGFLFIGHSETLHSISDDFSYLKILESPVYIPKMVD